MTRWAVLGLFSFAGIVAILGALEIWTRPDSGTSQVRSVSTEGGARSLVSGTVKKSWILELLEKSAEVRQTSATYEAWLTSGYRPTDIIEYMHDRLNAQKKLASHSDFVTPESELLDNALCLALAEIDNQKLPFFNSIFPKSCQTQLNEKVIQEVRISTSGIPAELKEKLRDVFHRFPVAIENGPSPETTEKLAALFSANSSNVTFLFMGNRMRNYPEIAQLIHSLGFGIGVLGLNQDYRLPLTTQKSQEELIEGLLVAKRVLNKPKVLSILSNQEVHTESRSPAAVYTEYEFNAEQSLSTHLELGTDQGPKIKAITKTFDSFDWKYSLANLWLSSFFTRLEELRTVELTPQTQSEIPYIVFREEDSLSSIILPILLKNELRH